MKPVDRNPFDRNTFDRNTFEGAPSHGRDPARSTLRRFLGGSPGAVLVKLMFLSLVVGALMSLIGLTPVGLLQRAVNAVRAIIDLGADALGEVGRWLLYGALVVVPLWLVTRLLNAGR